MRSVGRRRSAALSLLDETEIPMQKDKDAIKTELRTIIEGRDKEPDYERRLNAVVTKLYAAGLRQVVQALAK